MPGSRGRSRRKSSSSAARPRRSKTPHLSKCRLVSEKALILKIGLGKLEKIESALKVDFGSGSAVVEIQGRATQGDIEAAFYRSAHKTFEFYPLLVIADEFTLQAIDHAHEYSEVAILLRNGEKWKTSKELLYGGG